MRSNFNRFIAELNMNQEVVDNMVIEQEIDQENEEKQDVLDDLGDHQDNHGLGIPPDVRIPDTVFPDPPSPINTDLNRGGNRPRQVYTYDPYGSHVAQPIERRVNLNNDNTNSYEEYTNPRKGIVGSYAYGGIRGIRESEVITYGSGNANNNSQLQQIIAESVKAVASISSTPNVLDEANASANDVKIMNGRIHDPILGLLSFFHRHHGTGLTKNQLVVLVDKEPVLAYVSIVNVIDLYIMEMVKSIKSIKGIHVDSSLILRDLVKVQDALHFFAHSLSNQQLYEGDSVIPYLSSAFREQAASGSFAGVTSYTHQIRRVKVVHSMRFGASRGRRVPNFRYINRTKNTVKGNLGGHAFSSTNSISNGRTCFGFNDGVCTYGPACKYAHLCSNCRLPHPLKYCQAPK